MKEAGPRDRTEDKTRNFLEFVRKNYGEGLEARCASALREIPEDSGDPNLSAVLDDALREAGLNAVGSSAEFGATRCNS